VKRLQPLVFSAALLLLAACGQNTQPEAAAPSFSFSIDPGSETVNLTSADAALSAMQLGACGSDDPRILFPEEELALTSYNAVFLPGNILEITAEFTNVTDFTFEQPFTFTRADSTRNIISSQEPEVTDADLGGDGALSPDETTSTLTFTVEHMGQPFTYEVFAEAVVRCGDGGTDPGPGPGDPTLADLGVVKTGPAEVVLDANGDATLNYSVTVTNNGGVAAEGVVLTDTLAINLDGLVDVEATITAGILPEGCVVDATVADGNVLICTIGTLEAGASADLDFSFDLALLGDLTGVTSIPVTNTAEAITDTAEDVRDNNLVEVVTDLIVPVPGDPGLADLGVIKTGPAEVTLNPDGTAILDFNVVVTNDGTVAAEGVVLTDTLVIDLAGLAGITADITATGLPLGCSLDVSTSATGIITCNLDTLDVGEVADLDFSFNLALTGDLTGVTSIPVTNTAEAITDTAEDVLDNNLVEVVTDLLVPAVPAVANLTVTKDGTTTVETDANGDATLTYTVVVTNNGEAIAEGVELTDTFVIDLTGFAGDAILTASVLPDSCIFDVELTTDDVVVATCTLGALDAGGSSTLDFTFNVDLPADVPAGSSFPVGNTADATTTTDETDLADNTAVVAATVTVPGTATTP